MLSPSTWIENMGERRGKMPRAILAGGQRLICYLLFAICRSVRPEALRNPGLAKEAKVPASDFLLLNSGFWLLNSAS
jgi:hypothetical protein